MELCAGKRFRGRKGHLFLVRDQTGRGIDWNWGMRKQGGARLTHRGLTQKKLHATSRKEVNGALEAGFWAWSQVGTVLPGPNCLAIGVIVPSLQH